MKHILLTVLAGLMSAVPALAQEGNKSVSLHGSLQTDILVPQDDSKIGTEQSSDKLQTNTYLDINMTSRYVDLGARVEYLQHPLPGFEKDFQDWGAPHFYVKGKLRKAELTLGDFYEQFGSGFILRAYEERSLGIDNAIRGARAKVTAIEGVRLTALGGIQRRYWDWSTDSWLAGADAEFDVNRYVPALSRKNIWWTVGASWVMKNEKKPTQEAPLFVPGTAYTLQVPRNVHAFDVRSNLNLQNLSILAEAAFKSEDPSHDNGYTFRKGNAVLLSASYSKKGFSALLQAKRSENMAFRSQRSMTGISAFVNNMPAFAYQHTYALAALYPYATRYADISENGSTLVPGEWAFQGEVSYTFKRKTLLGGKYGTKVKVNFTQVRGLNAKPEAPVTLPDGTQSAYLYGGKGYSTRFFQTGERYYQDLNVQIEKKFSKQFKLNAMYMNQLYNQPVIENHGNLMRNNIIVADARYQFNSKVTLRLEYQHLFACVHKDEDFVTSQFDAQQDGYVNHLDQATKEMADEEKPGDWDYVLAELTVLPHLMFSVSDMYGKPYFADGYHAKEHFYLGSVTYTHGAHRLSLGYGRTRAGFNCSGGVCRWVPASKGVQIGYNYMF